MHLVRPHAHSNCEAVHSGKNLLVRISFTSSLIHFLPHRLGPSYFFNGCRSEDLYNIMKLSPSSLPSLQSSFPSWNLVPSMHAEPSLQGNSPDRQAGINQNIDIKISECREYRKSWARDRREWPFSIDEEMRVCESKQFSRIQAPLGYLSQSFFSFSSYRNEYSERIYFYFCLASVGDIFQRLARYTDRTTI